MKSIAYFLSYLLGKSEMIIYRKKLVEVWRLRGTTGIYIDSLGRLYIQRWEQEDEPAKTPGQRARKIWKPNERHFSRFDEGVTSAGRGLCLAKRGAWKKYIPQYERIKEIIEEELREKIITKSFFNWEELDRSERGRNFKKKILQSGFILGEGLKIELQEGFSQISCLIMDAGGKLNIGAALARTAAITDRLEERLKSIYSWLAVFSGYEQALAIIDNQFHKLGKEFEGELVRWSRHPFLTKGRLDNLQQKLLDDKVAVMAKKLRPFSELRPFGRWVSYALADLKEASKAIKKGDPFLAKAIINRVKVAVEVKKQQWGLDKLLQELRLNNGDRHGFLFQRVLDVRKKFQVLAPKEIAAGFAEPVCQKVADKLYEAAKGFEEKSLRKILKSIKEAYLLL